MRTFTFSNNQPNLLLELSFNGVMNLAYLIRLFESDGDTEVIRTSGTSTGSPVVFNLPNPVNSNDGRIIVVKCKFRGTSPAGFPNYTIKAKLIQNGIDINEDTRSGTLTGNEQSASMTIEIKL